MKIYMQKIGMIRPDFHPKNENLELNVEWVIEYTDINNNQTKFDIILKSSENFTLNFEIEGIVKLDSFEKFVQEEISQIIFHQSFKVLMDMISITKESNHNISTIPESKYTLNNAYIHDTLFN